MKKYHFLVLMFCVVFQAKAQFATWTFKEPVITIHFGAGSVRDVNTVMPHHYGRVGSSCPTDGHYTYTSYTSDCFRGDWFTLTEDHTPGDADGNLMLVNSSYDRGVFFRTDLNGLKGSTTYEFSVWMMNVCKISDKCPYPLLPNIAIQLQTRSGKSIAQFGTGELARRHTPGWALYRAIFTTPSTETSLNLVMSNNAPGGCGNDFALDDITIRECIIPTPTPLSSARPEKTVVAKKQPVTIKQAPKKAKYPDVTKTPTKTKEKAQTISGIKSPVIKQVRPIFPAPPAFLATRTNSLVKQLETEAGEIRLELYDNGEIDGDTVSVYLNGEPVLSREGLKASAIKKTIYPQNTGEDMQVVLVAENLGKYPPNTGLLVIRDGDAVYQVRFSADLENSPAIIFKKK